MGENTVRSAGVDVAVAYVDPFFFFLWPHHFRLTRSQDHVLHSVLNEGLHGGLIDGGFRQPHSFRFPSEPEGEITFTPDDLGFQILW